FFFQAEDGIRDFHVTGVQTCALPIYFYRNSIINPRFLTYHHTWWWFMEQLYGVYIAKRDEIRSMDKIFKTKRLVEEIMQSLGVRSEERCVATVRISRCTESLHSRTTL